MKKVAPTLRCSPTPEANPDLYRLALKLATGAGKTTVMAMLIAWQAINSARQPGSSLFTRGFLDDFPVWLQSRAERLAEVGNRYLNNLRGNLVIPELAAQDAAIEHAFDGE